MKASGGLVQEVRVWGFVQQGSSPVGCGGNYAFFTQNGRADAAFDSQDLRFDECALAVPGFVPEYVDALVLDVPNERVVPISWPRGGGT